MLNSAKKKKKKKNNLEFDVTLKYRYLALAYLDLKQANIIQEKINLAALSDGLKSTLNSI